VLVDPAAARVVEPARLQSLSRNTPFAGMKLPGAVVATFYCGRPTVLGGAVVETLETTAPDSGVQNYRGAQN
jgi:dihydroorotase